MVLSESRIRLPKKRPAHHPLVYFFMPYWKHMEQLIIVYVHTISDPNTILASYPLTSHAINKKIWSEQDKWEMLFPLSLDINLTVEIYGS